MGFLKDPIFYESIFRWLHVFAGVVWIGLLYFFNFVNSGFAPTMDAETKKKVIPELMPRALYWFRWGAAYTWIFGVLLLVLVFYHTPNLMEGQVEIPAGGWAVVAIAGLGFYVYDLLVKTVLKKPLATFWGGWILASAVVILFQNLAHVSFRGYAIHLGAMFGTTMFFNVWMRIWPSQKKIIAAIKNGQAPDPALVALAGTRSKHNTYMSVPLLFTMIGQHATWAGGPIPGGGKLLEHGNLLPVVILVGWGIVFLCYKKAAQVKGF